MTAVDFKDLIKGQIKQETNYREADLEFLLPNYLNDYKIQITMLTGLEITEEDYDREVVQFFTKGYCIARLDNPTASRIADYYIQALVDYASPKLF